MFKTKFILLLILVNFGYSQNNYQVKYKMTTLFDGLKSYDAKLTFSQQKSCFEYKLFDKDTITVEHTDENGNISMVFPDKNQQSIVTNLMDKKITERKNFATTFLVEDTLNIPQWNISNEIKSINNNKCQKATTFFKGRTYEVWYAVDYPTFFGPWKLNGLPGLIILAQDKKNEVYFEAIEIHKSNEPIFQEDNSIKRISKVDFDHRMEKKLKEYQERLKATGDRNLKIDIKFGKTIGIEIVE